MKFKLDESKELNEVNTLTGDDTLVDVVDKAAQELQVKDSDIAELDGSKKSEHELFAILDDSLAVAKKMHRYGKKEGWPNIMLIGMPGTGKTSITHQWANSRGVNLFVVPTSSMDELDVGGGATVDRDQKKFMKYRSGMLDQLEKENSVLFLDEYNRSRMTIADTLLQLVASHWIPDASEPSGRHIFKNLLFTIGAINPSEDDGGDMGDASNGTRSLNRAEWGRFIPYEMKVKKTETRDYLISELDKQLAMAKEDKDEEEILAIERKKNLVNTLLNSKDFTFDSNETVRTWSSGDNAIKWNKRTNDPRNLETLLNHCRTGKLNEFLAKWKQDMNNLTFNEIKRIFDNVNYVDIEDKANDALTGFSGEKVLKDDSKKDKVLAGLAKYKK